MVKPQQSELAYKLGVPCLPHVVTTLNFFEQDAEKHQPPSHHWGPSQHLARDHPVPKQADHHLGKRSTATTSTPKQCSRNNRGDGVPVWGAQGHHRRRLHPDHAQVDRSIARWSVNIFQAWRRCWSCGLPSAWAALLLCGLGPWGKRQGTWLVLLWSWWSWVSDMCNKPTLLGRFHPRGRWLRRVDGQLQRKHLQQRAHSSQSSQREVLAVLLWPDGSTRSSNHDQLRAAPHKAGEAHVHRPLDGHHDLLDYDELQTLDER